MNNYVHVADVEIEFDKYVAQLRKEAGEMGLAFTHEYYHFRALGARQYKDKLLKLVAHEE